MLARPAVAIDVVGPDPQVADVVVIAVRPAPAAGEPVVVDDRDVAVLESWGVDLPRRLARSSMTAARGELLWMDVERDHPQAVLAMGVGSGSPSDLRPSAAAAMRRLRGHRHVHVRATRDLDDAGLRAFTEGLLLGTDPPTLAREPRPAPPERIGLLATPVATARRAVAVGLLQGQATLDARVLVHTPPNVKDPAWLAERAVAQAHHVGLQVRSWDVEQLRADGFGGILAVGAGSVRPPRLVERHWSGHGGQAERHVVLVGKGITFDSGGLSLKPPDAQVLMKTDMAGAAAVLGVMAALPELAPVGIRVTAVLSLAENLPGAAALRPGDVVTHHGGLTSEVLNTDAEGRLVLGDGLDHAVRDLGADVVVDIATLTGAATLGLGRRHAALYSTSDALADALVRSGEAAGELMWRMPLHEPYADLIRSEVADQANSDRGPGPGPGSITAALFLRRFVGDTPWAHLDIAGVGRAEAEKDDLPKGGTGYGARAILRWLESGAPA